MTGQHLLLLMALTSGMTLVTVARRKLVGWMIVHGAFLAACAVGYTLDAERAGLWLIGPYAVFAIVPLVALVQVNRRMMARQYRAARVFAWIACVLHPSAYHRRLVQLSRTHGLIGEGKVDEAVALLRATGHEKDLELEVLRLQNRWPEVLAHIEALAPEPAQHTATPLYIRALGETGQLERMLAAYKAAMTYWARQSAESEEKSSSRLFVAAFLGQPALVEQICATSLRHYSPAIRQYWVGLAHAAGGDRDKAAAIWDELKRDPEARTRAAAEYRAAHPPVRLDAPTAEMTEVLALLARDVQDTATYTDTHADAPRAVLSYALVAVITVVHVYVWWRQQHDPDAIYDLGLFWSPAVVERGEWWRTVTAVFLHANWLHLAMNAFGLIWFGPFVERFLGRVRFAIVFALGGVGCFATLAALAALGLRGPTAALGASGAIMALIGASTAIFLRGSGRSPLAAARLRDMLGFVVLQAVFDALAPHVSMTGHIAGLAIGFVVGFVTARRR